MNEFNIERLREERGVEGNPATILTVKQLRGLLFLLPVQNIPVNSIGTTVSELRALLAQVEDQDTPVVEAIPDLSLVEVA